MKKIAEPTLEIPDFYLPFGGKLRAENRWGYLVKIIPWELVETCYQEWTSPKEWTVSA